MTKGIGKRERVRSLSEKDGTVMMIERLGERFEVEHYPLQVNKQSIWLHCGWLELVALHAPLDLDDSETSPKEEGSRVEWLSSGFEQQSSSLTVIVVNMLFVAFFPIHTVERMKRKRVNRARLNCTSSFCLVLLACLASNFGVTIRLLINSASRFSSFPPLGCPSRARLLLLCGSWASYYTLFRWF